MSISYRQSPEVTLENLDSEQLNKKNTPRPSRNPLINLPIAQRLVLGFLIPALIAALIAGTIGLQSAQLLSQESNFYQNLFQSYSSLTTGNDFLQLMNFKISATISDASIPHPAQDLLASDRSAVQGLETRYDNLLNDYIQHDLLSQHPDQAALFDEAGHTGQAAQQSTLASSAERTWQVYRSAQDQVLQDIQNGQYQNAAAVEHTQGELTYSDALSALRQLIQFDGRLTTDVQDATAIQQRNELITTLVAVVLILLAIGVIGRLIYGTLVRRLRRLRGVAQAVQLGQVGSRVLVDGRDEITDVSASVNTMLDTIVGLLEETRLQRDALVGAAERLFSDMRLANGGELDVRTAVNNDPIGMLGNAFNFTVGRFRRFVLRNQTTIEQLDVVTQQSIERADNFLANTRNLLRNPLPTPATTGLSWPAPGKSDSGKLQESPDAFNAALMTQMKAIRDQLQQITRQNIEQNGRGLLSLVEQAFRHCQQLAAGLRVSNATISPTLIQELRLLETTIRRLGTETQTFQLTATRNLTEIDTNLNQLSLTVRSADAPRLSVGLTTSQVQELTRLTEGFAQEVGGLAQSLRRIAQEMRSSLAPFRIEALESSER